MLACVLLFRFGWSLLFEREVTVSMYRKKLRINRYVFEAYSV